MFTGKVIRNLLAFVILLLCVSLVVVVVRRYEPVESPRDEDLPQTRVDVELQTVRYTETRNGEKVWTLEADRVDYLRDSGMSNLRDIRMTFFRSGASGDVVMQAREGLLDVEKRNVDIWGEVDIKTGNGLAMKTEKVRYREGKGTLTSDTPVEILSEGMVIHGGGMVYTVETGNLLLVNGVQTEISDMTAGGSP